MLAFKLVKQCTNKYNNLVGKKIAEGADGEVYHLLNDKNKVIKFSVCYLWKEENPKEIVYSRLEGFSKVQKNPDLFAKLYEYSYVGEGDRDTVNGKQKYLLFSYVMEKCYPITDDEKKVFHSLISHEDNNLVKQFSKEKTIDILKGLSVGLDFDFKLVLDFIDQLQKTTVKYTDIHPRNIMKDALGKFKFIDFDRIDM